MGYSSCLTETWPKWCESIRAACTYHKSRCQIAPVMWLTATSPNNMGATVERRIPEFFGTIPDALFVSRERFHCNNNASYMPICLRQCIQMDRKYSNVYQTQPWSG